MPTYLANFDFQEATDAANGVTTPTSGGHFSRTNQGVSPPTYVITNSAFVDNVLLPNRRNANWIGMWFHMSGLRGTTLETDFQDDPTRTLQLVPNIITSATLQFRTKDDTLGNYGALAPRYFFKIYRTNDVSSSTWGPANDPNTPFYGVRGLNAGPDGDARLLHDSVLTNMTLSEVETEFQFPLDVAKLNAIVQAGAWNEILALGILVTADHRTGRQAILYGNDRTTTDQATIDANCARIITTETAPFHSGHMGSPDEGQTRAVHDDRLGMPTLSKRRRRDGFTGSLLVRPEDVDPEDTPDEFKGSETEGSFERDE